MALDSLRGDREFRKVRAHGQAIRDPLFTLRVTEYRPRHGETWRPRAIIGIVVSKKTLKRAVDRNRARRRAREALRTLPGGLPACRAILLPNPAILDVPFTDLQAALTRALNRAPGRGGKGGSGKGGAQKGSGGGNPRGGGRVPAPVPPATQPALDSPEPDPHGGTA